jgi:hypothetical protein
MAKGVMAGAAKATRDQCRKLNRKARLDELISRWSAGAGG